MNPLKEQLNIAQQRTQKIIEKQNKYVLSSMPKIKRKKTLQINLITNLLMLILCLIGLIIFKAFWLISLLTVSYTHLVPAESINTALHVPAHPSMKPILFHWLKKAGKRQLMILSMRLLFHNP